MTSRHTGIIEFHGSGHRLWYASILAETLKRCRPSSIVSLIVPNKVRQQEDFITRFGTDISPFDKILSFDDRADKIASARLELRQEGIDECVLLDSDLNLLRLAISRGLGVPTGVQVMRAPEFGLQGLQVKSAVASFTKAALIAALSFRKQTRSVALLRSPLWRLNSPARPLTRLAKIRTQTDLIPTQSKNTSEKTTDLLIVGGLSERKYMEELIEAISKMPESSILSIRFLGQPTATVARILGTVEDKAFMKLTFIDDEQLDVEVSRARYVWCVYNSDLPSGIALRAISHESMLVAKSGTRLGRFVSANKIGLALDPHVDLVNFLSQLSSDRFDSSFTRPPLSQSTYCRGCFAEAVLPSPLPHKCDVYREPQRPCHNLQEMERQ